MSVKSLIALGLKHHATPWGATPHNDVEETADAEHSTTVSVVPDFGSAFQLAEKETFSCRLITGLDSVAIGIAAFDTIEVSKGYAQALCRAAHSGQILFCAERALECVHQTGQRRLKSLGTHILNHDLPEAEVFQIDLCSLDSVFPPIRSIRHQKHNLPSRTWPFFGRFRELSCIHEALARNRLVTLFGEGGIGTSSLAWRACIEAMRLSPTNVFLLKIRLDTDLEQIKTEVDEFFNLNSEFTRDKQDIYGGVDLVVLDDCHRNAAIARLACEALLEGERPLRVMAAAREPLGICGEAAIAVEGLEFRAQTAQLGFEPDAQRLLRSRVEVLNSGERQINREEAELICKSVDGNPSALIAAASFYVHSGFEKTLARFAKDPLVSNRHHRVNNANELSCDASKLSCLILTFGADWSFLALEHVAAEINHEFSPNTLRELVEKGLVELIVSSEGGIRFRAQDSMFQSNCDEQLVKRAKEGHCRYFLHLAEKLSKLQPGDMFRLDVERSNLRLALSRSLAGASAVEESHRFVIALGPYWHRRGHHHEAAELCIRAVSQEGAPQSVHFARLLNLAGTFLSARGRNEEALEMHSKAHAVAKERSDELASAMAMGNIASVYRAQGKIELAVEAAHQASIQLRRLNEKYRLASLLANLASMQEERGRFEEAESSLQEAAKEFDAMGDRWSASRVRFNQAELESHRRDYSKAIPFYCRSLSEAIELADPIQIALCLEGIGICKAQLSQYSSAVITFGAAARQRKECGSRLDGTHAERVSSALAETRRALGELSANTQLESAGLIQPREALDFLRAGEFDHCEL